MKSGIDLTGLSFEGTPLGPDATILDCDILEVDEKGKVLWSWVATEHFDTAKVSVWPIPAGTLTDGGFILDAYHCNSIDVDPANGNLLVSARQADTIFYIDRVTDKILWKMGGPDSTMDHAVYVPVPDGFVGQHDARLQPGWNAACGGGSGQISLFDDETSSFSFPGAHARAVLYDVQVEAPDAGAEGCDAGGGDAGDGGRGDAGDAGDAGEAGAAKRGATVAWQYKGNMPCADMGSFRILPDGSHVVDWGASGGAPGVPTASEVSLAGEDILDIQADLGGVDQSYRTIKVPLSALDIGAMRLSAGH
jgi:hypothetical protein